MKHAQNLIASTAVAVLTFLSSAAGQAPVVRWAPGNSITIRPQYSLPNVPTSQAALDPRGAAAAEAMNAVGEFIDGPGGDMMAAARQRMKENEEAAKLAKRLDAYKSVNELRSYETTAQNPVQETYRKQFNEILEKQRTEMANNPTKYVGREYIKPLPETTCPTKSGSSSRCEGPAFEAAPVDHEAEINRILRNNPDLRRKFLNSDPTPERIANRAEFEDNAFKYNDADEAVQIIQAEQFRRLKLRQQAEEIDAEEVSEQNAASGDEELRSPDNEDEVQSAGIGDDIEYQEPRHEAYHGSGYYAE